MLYPPPLYMTTTTTTTTRAPPFELEVLEGVLMVATGTGTG